MQLLAIPLLVYIVHTMTEGRINGGLPDYVPQQNFGLVGVLYVLLKCFGAMCFTWLLIPLAVNHVIKREALLISVGCFLLAWIIKKIVRRLAYKDYL